MLQIVRWKFAGPFKNEAQLRPKPGVLVAGYRDERDRFDIEESIPARDVRASAERLTTERDQTDGRLLFAAHYTDDRLDILKIGQTIRIAFDLPVQEKSI